MKYVAVLGRQPAISLAELESLFDDVQLIGDGLASFESDETVDIDRLGGCLKLARPVSGGVMKMLGALPEGKITLGVSDYSAKATPRKAAEEALKLKKILVRHGRSVRVVPNKQTVLSTATAFHNGLGRGERKVELLKIGGNWYYSVGVQDIEAYARRDQARPARDARVGMLPPKLAQILINLCGRLEPGAKVLDPFCGTGVVLQEAWLMGYEPYGTDVDERMVEYSRRNLEWLVQSDKSLSSGRVRSARLHGGAPLMLGSSLRTPSDKLLSDCQQAPRFPESNASLATSQGDATSYRWVERVDAVACETYLGQPMSQPPAEIKLKDEQQKCWGIITGFLRNIAPQIQSGTPLVLAVPAWLRPNGSYSRLKLLDEVGNLGYNVVKFKTASQEDLLYHRPGQVVAREIIVLRKK